MKWGILATGTIAEKFADTVNHMEQEDETLIACASRNLEHGKAFASKYGIPKVYGSYAQMMTDSEVDAVYIATPNSLHYENCRMCLEAGKNVVTANKDLIAADGHILLDTAAKNKKDFLHEAAVAGGIPIIRPIKQCLAGNHISEVMGIMNGTTNFILTKMSQNGMEFADALKLAQELGYAESDPTADVEGLDAGRKVAILASAAFNSRVTFDDVYTEGITKITATDIQYAKEMGCVIKLLGVARNTPEGIEARVHPMLIDVNHPLASVNDAYNAVFVQGDAVQDAMFYGRGAGELPTASAVVGDVFDIVRNILNDCCGRIGCTCYKNLPIKHMNEISSKFFIRMFVEDRPGVLANIASVFGNSGVSLAQVIQRRKKDQYAEIVVITDDVKEKNLKDALAVAKGMSTVKEISGMIRVA